MKYLVNYQCEFAKGKLTAVANFEKLTLQAQALRQSSDAGLTLETSAFQNLLWWLVYPCQLHVDN